MINVEKCYWMYKQWLKYIIGKIIDVICNAKKQMDD